MWGAAAWGVWGRAWRCCRHDRVRVGWRCVRAHTCTRVCKGSRASAPGAQLSLTREGCPRHVPRVPAPGEGTGRPCAGWAACRLARGRVTPSCHTVGREFSPAASAALGPAILARAEHPACPHGAPSMSLYSTQSVPIQPPVCPHRAPSMSPYSTQCVPTGMPSMSPYSTWHACTHGAPRVSPYGT